MIAKIIPIKRFPRALDVFDYAVPEDLQSSIAVGQLIIAPLRKSTVYGLVLNLVKKEPGPELRDIASIVQDEPLVDASYLQQIIDIAAFYGVAPGTIAKMGLLPMQKRKLTKIELSPLSQQRDGEKSYSTETYSTPDAHKALLGRLRADVTAIIVPEVHLIEEVVSLLEEDVVVWHSALSDKEKFSRWLDIRNGEKHIIVGTRSTLLLPIPNLETVIIDYEHDENHKHWDQAPRFHVKDLVRFTNAKNIHFISFSPSALSYFGVHKEKINGSIVFKDRPLPYIINMREERLAGHKGVLSEPLKDMIRTATGDVFLFVHRKGFARSIACSHCGKAEMCENCSLPMIYSEKSRLLRCLHCKENRKVPMICTSCKGPMTKLSGAGTESVEKAVQDMLFGKETHDIVRIDSSADIADRSERPRIVIGTRMAFAHIDWQNTDLVAFVDIDGLLRIPEYLLEEDVWHTIADVQYRKQRDGQFAIQTFNPTHLIFRSLGEPDRFYRTNLSHRKALLYPPYSYLTRYFFGHTNEETAKKSVYMVKKKLEHELTAAGKEARVSDSIEMHPRYYRGKFWYSISVKSPASSCQEDVLFMNQFIPSQWKIDPNPISLLSP